MFINLTSHAIRVLNLEGQEHVFEPSGSIARVSVTTMVMPAIEGFRRIGQVFGRIEGLPRPQEGTFYIVSGMVKGQTRARPDVLAPDTGKDAVRNEQGHIVAVRGFV